MVLLLCVVIAESVYILTVRHNTRTRVRTSVDILKDRLKPCKTLECELPDDGRSICVKPSSLHGNGVFASRDFDKGEVVESCPVVLIETTSMASLPLRLLLFSDGNGKQVMALGYGSLYNHSFTPNAAFHFTDNTLRITALKDILEGDEILINYGVGYWKNNKEALNTP